MDLGKSSPPQLRRGGAPKGEPDRAKPQSKVAGVVLINRLILLSNTTRASAFILCFAPSGSRFAAAALPSSAEEGSLRNSRLFVQSPSLFRFSNQNVFRNSRSASFSVAFKLTP